MRKVCAFPIELRLEDSGRFRRPPLHPVYAEVDFGKENALRVVADHRVKHYQFTVLDRDGGVAHFRRKERRSLFEVGQSICRSIKDAWHPKRIVVASPLEQAEIGISEGLGRGLESQAVFRAGDERDLLVAVVTGGGPGDVHRAVKVHPDSSRLRIDVHVG